jgi:hypothetical protein
MLKYRILLYLLTAVILSGCGQTVVETLHVTDSSGAGAGNKQTVLILPFADYTSADSLAGAYRRNLSVNEALTDRFVSNGFHIAIQEDVFKYLVDENIIDIMAYEGNNTESLSAELNNEWSDEMKSLLRGYITSQKMREDRPVTTSPGTHAIDAKAIVKMGRHFSADYIVRGRLLEYKTRQEATWAPWKKGILPFINGGTSRIIGGFAASDDYDAVNETLVGAGYGTIIGYNYAEMPWHESDDILGMLDGSANTVFWGAVGAGLGAVSHNSGKVDQAAVQMRIWVQDGTTGEVLWTNRVRVLVSPESIFADNQYDTLFNAAIEKAVTSLVDNFIAYAL